MFTSILAGIAIIVSVRMYRSEKWTKGKAVVFPFFILYICLVMGITIFNRLPYQDARYNFEVFWSYREAMAGSRKLMREIILNYCMLVPLGAMAPLYIRKRWVIAGGFLFSVMIELVQILTRRGLFEFDDIIGNTLGVIFGVIIYTGIEMIRRSLQ